jgi:RNA polymerase-binding transcription factor DksA
VPQDKKDESEGYKDLFGKFDWSGFRRIECGTYGICEVTGEPIERARLRAIPWARFSLRGQQEVEAGGSGRRRAIPALQSRVEAELTSEPESGEPEREQAA